MVWKRQPKSIGNMVISCLMRVILAGLTILCSQFFFFFFLRKSPAQRKHLIWAYYERLLHLSECPQCWPVVTDSVSKTVLHSPVGQHNYFTKIFCTLRIDMMHILRSIVRPSAHSGGKNWQKVGTGDF